MEYQRKLKIMWHKHCFFSLENLIENEKPLNRNGRPGGIKNFRLGNLLQDIY